MLQLEIAGSFAGAHVDRIDAEAIGVLRVIGWARSTPSISLTLESGEVVEPAMFKEYRPDLAEITGSDLSGFSAEFDLIDSASVVTLAINEERLNLPADVNAHLGALAAPYPHLRKSDVVYTREHIYTSGPAMRDADVTLVALSKLLPVPLLDFGCGSGALVAALAAEGVDAHGIEMESRADELLADARERVILYDGELPLPFADESFAAVTAFEVIEHIPEYEAVLAELARVTSDSLTVSVPDMSSIPLGSAHGVVPWHLMESTHFNFFTRTSLQKALDPWFEVGEWSRLGGNYVNGTFLPGSIVAMARKRR